MTPSKTATFHTFQFPEMILAIHITPTGLPDLNAPYEAVHQPKPARIEAKFYGIDMKEIGSMDAIIRPEGWRIPESTGVSQMTAERFGVNMKNPLSMITGKGGWIDGAGFILCHDFELLDFLMKIWRTTLGGNPEWLRPRVQRLDTATACQPVLNINDSTSLFPDMKKRPTLKEATEQLCGEAIGGLNGVLSLYQHLNSQGIMKEVAA